MRYYLLAALIISLSNTLIMDTTKGADIDQENNDFDQDNETFYTNDNFIEVTLQDIDNDDDMDALDQTTNDIIGGYFVENMKIVGTLRYINKRYILKNHEWSDEKYRGIPVANPLHIFCHVFDENESYKCSEAYKKAWAEELHRHLDRKIEMPSNALRLNLGQIGDSKNEIDAIMLEEKAH